ncbi:Bromodomain-containing protein [Phlegmacium glaucopus]|nr:Bromodomain-containing protein [Phlegmacium glaucopus]
MNHAPPPPDTISDYIHKIQNGCNNNSPPTDSPTTPVSNSVVPDVKIDMDFQEQESDVRHEPLPIKPIDTIDKNDDQDPIPIQNSSPTPDDIKMAEELQINGSVAVHINGHLDDVQMADTDSQTPGATPGISGDFSMASIDGSSTSMTRSYPDDSDEHGEPPAKRARMLSSDVDMRYTAHVSPYFFPSSATPPPVSATISAAASPAAQTTPSATPVTSAPPTTAATSQQESTLSAAQHRFCLSTIRSLKKLKDAGPFQRPVDIVALNIPHYPSIIKTPMDFSTIDRKLVASHPAKLDHNENTPRYHSADEFIADVRLIFQNTATFNGPDHVVTAMGRRLQDVFDKQLKNLPPPEKPKPPVVKKVATPVPVPPPAPVVAPKKVVAPAPTARRPSTSVPVIRRSEAEAIGRPKREIHPPPPKDLPYADAPKKHRKTKRIKDDGTIEQLKYCGKILQELHRKQHYNSAHPFYEPVDWVKMEIPTYPKIVKKPMDLSTIRRKLDNQEYTTAQKFYDDFKLMIRNCFLFNPSGTPVNLAGIELQRLFDEKWKHLPPLHEASEEEEEEEEDESEEEHQRAISLMENQIKVMNENLAALKSAKLPKEKKKKEKKKEKAPVASTSKAAPKQPKAPSKKKAKKNIADDDILSFEQKKDLSESISKLEGSKLEKVIQIIHEGVPEIRDSTEEIELEIDQLPAAVLTKLYNYVLRPLRQPAQPKRNRTGKGTGTGGLKRKSMDEEKEAEKIRQLEERMLLFENRGGASAAAAAAPHVRREVDSGDSSDSSSGSESSGSDSE